MSVAVPQPGGDAAQAAARGTPRAGVISLTPFLCFLAAFFLPMKALRLSIGQLSLYLPFFAIGLAALLAPRALAGIGLRFFAGPFLVLLGFTLLDFARAGFDPSVFVFTFKILIMLAMAATYYWLLRCDETAVMRALSWGIYATVAFMLYQYVSVTFFHQALPLTTVQGLEIGRGIGGRYGFTRVTGFTEEPSYVAVMLLGSLFLLRSYQQRSGVSQRRTIGVIVAGLLLCTSNSLFAALPILLLFSLFYRLRITWLFFVVFYAANLLIYPIVLNRDETFFARFSSYSQFAALPPDQKILGIGFNQYATLELPQFVNALGITTQIVESLGSLWGGLLLEGGIIFTVIFCLYVDHLIRGARWGTGYALMAILIMLANYYSPWWPIVSLALAYVLYSRAPFRAGRAGARRTALKEKEDNIPT